MSACPHPGIGHLKNQADRGRAYRIYLEDAAADPYCVGVHWFTLYDQSRARPLRRRELQHRLPRHLQPPYEEMGAAAIASHERMYQVASGAVQPFADAPEYLPPLSV